MNRVTDQAGRAIVLAAVAVAAPAAFAAPGVPGDPVAIVADLEVDGRAAYLKHPLKVKLSFRNTLQDPVILEETAFLKGAFTVRDARGRIVSPSAARGDDVPPADPSPLTIPGLGPAEKVVDLTPWYPKLTRRKSTWEITWAHGDQRAGPIHVVVIPPYDPERDRTAILETDLGRVTWALLPEHAPDHVRNFVNLARQGHYDGLTFHRYVPQMMAEGGDPKGDGTGAWDHLLPPEISQTLIPETGYVGASRRETSMTSDTMFFITLNPAPHMAGRQTFFAKVTDGYEVIARINQVPRRDLYLLEEPVRIHRIRIK